MRRGFTLLEMLIVITIIAILMALLLPVLAAAKRHSKEVGCAANVRSMKTALDNYYAEWGGIYPIQPGKTGDVFNAGGGQPGYYQTVCVAQKSVTSPAPSGVEHNYDLVWVLTINKYLSVDNTNFINDPADPSGRSRPDFVDYFKTPIVCRFLIEPAWDPIANKFVSATLTQKAYIWSYGADRCNWQNATPAFTNGGMPNYDGTRDLTSSEAFILEAAPVSGDNNLTNWR